jgi:hypothetical protein
MMEAVAFIIAVHRACMCETGWKVGRYLQASHVGLCRPFDGISAAG